MHHQVSAHKLPSVYATTHDHWFLAPSLIGRLHPVAQSQASFFLACAEQLIPVVSDETVERAILPFAQP